MSTATAAGIESLRQRAAEQFAREGYPTPRNEDWKFTSVAPIAQESWQAPPDRGRSISPEEIESFRLGLPAHEMVFVNGRYHPELSGGAALPEGVTVTSLAQALQSNPGQIQESLGAIADFRTHAFTALNTAQMADGAVIRIRRGCRAGIPVHLLFLADGAAGPWAAHPRNLIVADESSELTVIETFGATADGPYFTNAVTEVAVGPNARVEHIKLQRESEQAFHVGTIEARQQRDSRFKSFSFALGGALARTNVYSVMEGEGSVCTMNGLYMLHGKQHIDHQTRIEHAAPNCSSREVYKGILDGQSHAVFNGKVYVRPEAQKTDGKQTNKNLLLSDGAKVDTKPQLEIFADDVKCTHGATVGRLDEIGLFYLASRGLSAARARRMLTYGFAAEVLGEIDQDPLRHLLERLVFERLESSLG